MSALLGRALVSALALTLLLSLVLSTSRAFAQEEGLMPDWGSGTLIVRGSGFKAGEAVTLTARVGAVQQTFTVTADAAGRFTVRTGLQVAAGQGVSLDARGTQGTS